MKSVKEDCLCDTIILEDAREHTMCNKDDIDFIISYGDLPSIFCDNKDLTERKLFWMLRCVDASHCLRAYYRYTELMGMLTEGKLTACEGFVACDLPLKCMYDLYDLAIKRLEALAEKIKGAGKKQKLQR